LILIPRAYEAKPALTLVELAKARTKVALNSAVFERVPVLGWNRTWNDVHVVK
jgi:hypothetical protein